MNKNDEEKEFEIEAAESPLEVKEGDEDKNDYKALAERNAGIAKRNATKLEKLKLKNAKNEGKSEAEKEAEKNKGFDLGQKAFLKASGIQSSEYKFVQEYMADTGKDLETVLESARFQAELKDLRDAEATKTATPTDSKRANTQTRDTVDYWIDKKDDKGNLILPPADQRELRTKVVNERVKRQKSGSQFSSNPVV